ncbi:MAG: efflux transporter outer membrane subunit [Burkholderiaceae bacterium]
MNSRLPFRLAAWFAVTVALAGCAGLAPTPTASPAFAAQVQADTLPPVWQATLPDAAPAGDLARWWSSFDDPLLAGLVDAAQAASPSIAAAASRIEQARAARVAAGAALLPTLDATARASRGRADLSLPTASALGVGLQAAWEIDLFGAGRAGRAAADARFEATSANWRAARISLAAEVASAYSTLRACEAQIAQASADAASRSETARLTQLAADAGFQPPANAALTRASAAQANARLTRQRAACELNLKALVALTGIAEPDLRGRLGGATARLPQSKAIAVASVPAQALAQRPDLVAAERELLAAAAEIDQASAQRYPRITLSGNLGTSRIEAGTGSPDGAVWSIGPVAVRLPIFDGGTRNATVDAARARHTAAASAYAGSLRTAVREVESALVDLQSSADRAADVRTAADGFAASLRATQARYDGGLASLFELEDARRSAVQAEVALIDLARERLMAWINLYRALGGGWTL